MSLDILNIRKEHDGKVEAYRTRPDQMRHPHRHEELEMNMVLEGTARYLLAGRTYLLGAGDMVWLFPEQEHLLVDASADFRMWIPLFRRGLVEHAFRFSSHHPLLQGDPAGHYCSKISREKRAKLLALCEEAYDLQEAARINAAVHYLIVAAWEAFQQGDPLSEEESLHPAVAKAAHLLRERPETATIQDIVKHVGLSRSHLSRLFKQQIGMSLVTFRNRGRIDAFLARYGSGQRATMLMVALDVGFGSYAQFHRAFRQVMGCSPQAFQRRRRRSLA